MPQRPWSRGTSLLATRPPCRASARRLALPAQASSFARAGHGLLPSTSLSESRSRARRSSFIDEASYQRVLKAARQELRDFCDKQGKVSIRLDATIATAAKR